MARPIAHSIKVDQTGTEHMLMHFNVEGPKGKGVVSLHMTKKPVAGSEYEYKYLKLDVRGEPTHYIEGGTASSVKKGATKFLGISWR
jgi:import inner membrane translocase subunit TIM21